VIGTAAQLLCIEREHRQDDEHAEHAQAENAGQRKAGAQLGGAHRA
jgi:hypothetical protein